MKKKAEELKKEIMLKAVPNSAYCPGEEAGGMHLVTWVFVVVCALIVIGVVVYNIM